MQAFADHQSKTATAVPAKSFDLSIIEAVYLVTQLQVK